MDIGDLMLKFKYIGHDIPYLKKLGIGLCICIGVLVSACSDEEAPGSYQANVEGAGGIPGTPEIPDACEPNECNNDDSQTFQIATGEAPLDLIWVIDNSASMTEEAASVRANFQNFIDSVEGETDLRIGLISAASGSRGVALPEADTNPNRLQVNRAVGSNNGPALAAIATCPKEQADLTDVDRVCPEGPPISSIEVGSLRFNDICGQPFETPVLCESNGTQYVIPDETVQALQAQLDRDLGAIHEFIRPEARLAYVFVTDDNARFVDSENFVQLIRTGLVNKEPVVYAFRGFLQDPAAPKPNCRVDGVGTEYEALAQNTGGLTFDICEPDWGPNFGILTEDVVGEAQNSVTINQGNVCGITSATVAGNLISPDNYRLQGQSLVFDEGILMPGVDVVVDYSFSDEPLKPPVSALVGAPEDGSLEEALNIRVGGPDVVSYVYQLIDGGTECPPLEDVGYSDLRDVGVLITDPVPTSGPKLLCVIGFNDDGTAQCEPTAHSWLQGEEAPPPPPPPPPSACAEELNQYWDVDESDIEGAGISLVSNGPGDWEGLSVYYSPSFEQSRGTTGLMLEWKIRYPTEIGSRWREQNKVWVGLADDDCNQLYQILFKPNRKEDLYTSFDLEFKRKGEEEVRVEGFSRRLTAPFRELSFQAIFEPSTTQSGTGTVRVLYDAGDGRGPIEYITLVDETYEVFNRIFVRYKTGTDEENYTAEVNDVKLSPLPM